MLAAASPLLIPSVLGKKRRKRALDLENDEDASLRFKKYIFNLEKKKY
jgi:hypothetical protein